MKIKNDDFVISYTLRQLAKDKNIQHIVKELNERKSSKDIIPIYLPLANECINKIADDPNLHEQGFNSCYELSDSLLINELINIKVLSTPNDYVFTENDNGLFVADIIINNPDFIEHYYEWIKDADHILNYGIFSLHTFTGEAYCLDNKSVFPTDSGIFRVFKAFIQEPTHILSYNQINSVFINDDIQDPDSLVIQQAIYKIKKKLDMEGEFKKLFLPSGNKYLLRSL